MKLWKKADKEKKETMDLGTKVIKKGKILNAEYF